MYVSTGFTPTACTFTRTFEGRKGKGREGKRRRRKKVSKRGIEGEGEEKKEGLLEMVGVQEYVSFEVSRLQGLRIRKLRLSRIQPFW
jgi:hypothetical protein